MHCHPSNLLRRSQTACRIIALLSQERQSELLQVAIQLSLIERLIRHVIDAPESLFESAVLEVLEDSVQDAADKIESAVRNDDRS